MFISSVVVTDERQAEAERIATTASLSAEQILASPYYLIGSVDAIVDQLLDQRERFGISYICIFPTDTEAFAPIVARLAGR